MSPLAQSLMSLPRDEKFRLVLELWDALAEERDKLPLSDANKKELQDSLDAYRSTGDKGDTWQSVKARILGKR